MSTLARIAPELPSDDLNEAVAYYEQKLGFKSCPAVAWKRVRDR